MAQGTQAIPFNRKIIVAVLLSAAFLTVLSQTMMVVAIPPIMNEFHIDAGQAQWLTTAFMLMNGVLIPVSAFLIEKFSSRSLLITALLIFIVGTVIGAVATSFPVLVLARVIQAGGAGIMMPLMQTVLLTLYPPEKRGSIMGLSGLVISFAPAIGPTLSGWILDSFSWRSLFYVLLPIAVAVLVLAISLMKNVTAQRDIHIHVPSIIFSTFGWGGLLYGFSMIGSMGFAEPTVYISLIIGAVSLVIFISKQLRMETPLLEFKVFRSRVFAMTTLLGVFVFALMIGTQMFLVIYTQDVKGFNTFESGLVLLPGAVINGILSPIVGRIFDKVGGRGLSIGGFACMVLAMGLFINIHMDTPVMFIVLGHIILMIGMTMTMMTMMTAGMNALPLHLIPHGTAMMNTIRMVAGSILTGMLVSVYGIASLKHAGSGLAVATHEATIAAFIATLVLALVGLLLSLTIKRKPEHVELRGKA